MTLGQKVVFCVLFVIGQNIEFGWISCGAVIFFSAMAVWLFGSCVMSSLR